MARLWIVTYDIADPKRLHRVATELERQGTRVQKSVFELWCSRDALRTLRRQLQALTDPGEDSIRYYPLCGSCVTKVRWQGSGDSPGGALYWVV